MRVGETAVVCGIQPEILLASEIADPPRRSRQRRRRAFEKAETEQERERIGREKQEDLAHLQLLVPNIDLATGCSPSHPPGQAPDAAAQSLSHRLYRLLLSSSLVDLSDLEIWHEKPLDVPRSGEGETEDGDEEEREEIVAYFVLHMHLTVLSLSGQASLLDAAWLAVLSALRDLRLPRTTWNADLGMVLCDDNARKAVGLGLNGRPVACTWGVFESAGAEKSPIENPDNKRWTLGDPDAFEEGVCDEFITMVVDRSNGTKRAKILKLEKSGGGSTGPEEFRTLLGQAEQRWKDVANALPKPYGTL